MGLFFSKKNSGKAAKDRLKLSIVADRAGCSPEIMEQIKEDIITVISKYVEIDTDGLDIKVTPPTSGNAGPALYAIIPIVGQK
ncbi:MAG: cell division topological specificity factor MinE, partial [Lachnospiraceae bacterium]|nr:cell division topological specificity factor MinE [Lachnospiraceae bacterium]